MGAMTHDDFRGAALGFITQLAANLKDKDKVRGGGKETAVKDGPACGRSAQITGNKEDGWEFHKFQITPKMPLNILASAVTVMLL